MSHAQTRPAEQPPVMQCESAADDSASANAEQRNSEVVFSPVPGIVSISEYDSTPETADRINNMVLIVAVIGCLAAGLLYLFQ
jgi:hypothetical protein